MVLIVVRLVLARKNKVPKIDTQKLHVKRKYVNKQVYGLILIPFQCLMLSKLLAALLKSYGTRICRRRLLHSLIYDKRTILYTSMYVMYWCTFLQALNGFRRCDTPNQNVIRVFAIIPRNTQCIISTVIPAHTCRSKGLCMHKMLAPLMPFCCIMNNMHQWHIPSSTGIKFATTYWVILVNSISGICHNWTMAPGYTSSDVWPIPV